MSKTTDRLDRIEELLEELVMLMRLLILRDKGTAPEDMDSPVPYPQHPVYPPYYPPVMPAPQQPEPWISPPPVTCEPTGMPPQIIPTITVSDAEQK